MLNTCLRVLSGLKHIHAHRFLAFDLIFPLLTMFDRCCDNHVNSYVEMSGMFFFILGQFLLTNLLLNKLIASAPSRIINVSSTGYNTTRIGFTDLNSAKYYNSKDAYKQSKLAITMFTHELAKRLQSTNLASDV